MVIEAQPAHPRFLLHQRRDQAIFGKAESGSEVESFLQAIDFAHVLAVQTTQVQRAPGQDRQIRARRAQGSTKR